MAAKSARRFGLEISNSAVRIAELSGGSRPKLVNLGQVRLPARAVVDGVIVDVLAVTAAIERCVKEGGFAVKEVHLGVAGLRAITRELDMPQVPDSELDAAVRLQALDVIPFPPEKTLLSARPLEDIVMPDGTAMRRVLLAAAHRDLVDPLVEAVTNAGLVPLSVDLSSTAVVRALYDPSVPSSGPEAVVSIGSGLTTIVVHEGGVPHFVRTIAEGGDTVTAAIAGALDLPIDDAESTKRNLDQAGPHIRAAAAAAAEAAGSLIAEIRSSVEYYSTLPGRSEVRSVTLTGGGSRLAGFAERLQQQVRATVIQGSALARLDTSALGLRPDDIMRRDPLVATVIGLALPDGPGVKSLDLMPPEITIARRQKRSERLVFAVAAVIVLALVGLGVTKYLDVHNAENNVTSLTAESQTLQNQINQKNSAARTYATIQSDEGTVVPLLQNEVDWPTVYADLAVATPPGGTITTVSGSAAVSTAPTTASTGATTTTTTPGAPQTQAERESVVIANLSISVSVQSKLGLSYFKTWLAAMSTSPQFRDVSFSALSQPSKGQVSFTAQLEVLGTIQSGRAKTYEVTK